MRDYRCYFFEKKGGPSEVWRAFQGEGDGEAEDYALGLLAGNPHADKVEVWDHDRLTLSYSRSATQTPAEMRRLCHLAVAAARKEPDPKIKAAISSGAAALSQEAEALERRTNEGVTDKGGALMTSPKTIAGAETT